MMQASDAIAVGALAVSLVALGVSIWQALQNRPQLRVGVAAGMRVMTQMSDDGPYVIITATNIGTQPTTVTGFGFQAYTNWFDYWRRRGDGGMLGVGGGYSSPLPHLLEPGREGRFLAEQDRELLEYVRDNGIVAALVMHSWSEKPCRRILSRPTRNKMTEALERVRQA